MGADVWAQAAPAARGAHKIATEASRNPLGIDVSTTEDCKNLARRGRSVIVGDEACALSPLRGFAVPAMKTGVSVELMS